MHHRFRHARFRLSGRQPGRLGSLHVHVVAVALLALAINLALPVLARADGVIVVEPPPCDAPSGCPSPVVIADQLIIKYHRVDVTIADQVATTRIDQVFHNPNDWVAEGTYLFPVPADATVSDFVMWVDGQQIEATIRDANEARAIYDEIVRSLRDPALLEYVGRGLIQASVFPIPPGEDRRIEIQYQQVLAAEGGLFHYVYPLNTERFSAQPLEQVGVRVSVASASPVRAIYSPSHEIAVDRQDDFHFVAGYEETYVTPTTDFELFYSVSEEQIGANLLSYWDPVAQEGYFLLLAAPGIAAPESIVAKDVVIVLDTSGSMEGEKIVQAKEALKFILSHLNAEDRFNIVEFSTGAREYATDLQPAADAANAIAWVDRLQATGGTDINLALLEGLAMAQPERPTIVVFLTDGLPTEGEVDVASILNNVQNSAPVNVRLFAFGVGDDVDTYLLDSLAQNHHGASTYVRPGQPLDEIVSGFWAKVSAPVLTNVEIDFGGIQVEEIYPTPVPDLFAGTQLVIAGRYRAGGATTITLSGDVGGQVQTFTYEGQTFVTSGGQDFLPRLWATRKIGYLLNQIRLHGENQEWVQAIVDLSVRFGIVTPYTSYLITEDDILTQEGRAAAAEEAEDEFAAANAEPASGSGAVDRAVAGGEMADADQAAAPVQATFVAEDGSVTSAAEVLTYVGSRAFVLQNGVWTETTYDPSTMTTIKVQFASDDYFKLLELRPDLAEAFALGIRVIAISNGQAFEVTEEEQPPIDFDALAATLPQAAVSPLAGRA